MENIRNKFLSEILIRSKEIIEIIISSNNSINFSECNGVILYKIPYDKGRYDINSDEKNDGLLIIINEPLLDSQSKIEYNQNILSSSLNISDEEKFKNMCDEYIKVVCDPNNQNIDTGHMSLKYEPNIVEFKIDKGNIKILMTCKF